MGKYITVNKDVDLAGLTPDFRIKIDRWLTSLPFDTIIYSGYRSLAEQKALRDAYESGKRKAVANKPGYSAHNWGLAIDVHPVSLKDKDYETMLTTSKAHGLKRDSKERWHFQDTIFDFKKAELWLKEIASGVKKNKGPTIIITVIIITIVVIIIIRNK